MHILMLCRNREWDGTFFRCFFLSKYLVKYGHEVLLSCVNRKATLRIEKTSIQGIDILKLPFWTWGSNFSLDPLAHVIRALINFDLLAFLDADVVHSFSVASPTTGAPVLLFKILEFFRPRKCKVIVDWDDWWGRGGFFRKYGKFMDIVVTLLEEKIPLSANAVTVVSDALKRRASEGGIKKVYKIPNGANIDFFKPLPKAYARGKLGLPYDRKIVSYVHKEGLITIKNLRLLIRELMGVIRSSHALMLIVGHMSGDDIRIINANNTQGIIYVGRQPYDKMPLYLAASDTLILPMEASIVESARWPIRLGDYLASGRAIVATAVGEVKNVLQKGRCGLFADPSDFEDFAKKVEELINNPRLCEELGTRAREVAEKDYDWRIITKKLESVYRIVCKAQGVT